MAHRETPVSYNLQIMKYWFVLALLAILLALPLSAESTGCRVVRAEGWSYGNTTNLDRGLHLPEKARLTKTGSEDLVLNQNSKWLVYQCERGCSVEACTDKPQPGVKVKTFD